jgi:shikimate 5-dehydrogenase
MKKSKGADKPSRIIITNRSPGRLEEMKRIHAGLSTGVPVEYRLAPGPAENDRAVSELIPRSLVVNATGLGKDTPGSPITSDAVFPESGFAWDFNYRGNLEFLDQARKQGGERHLTVQDGWTYFLYGWLMVMAEIFRVDIPVRGRAFEEISAIAAKHRA